MCDEIIGSEIGLISLGPLARCREGDQQRQNRAIERDGTNSSCFDNSRFVFGREKSVRLRSWLRDICQCDLLLMAIVKMEFDESSPKRSRETGRARTTAFPMITQRRFPSCA